MRKVLVSLLLLVFMGVLASVASAQWREIGSKEVDYNLDHDTMNITAWKGDFRRIRIGVSRAPVRFVLIVLTYGNGNTQEISIRSLIRPGGFSRSIDLRGRERVLNKVEFWYQSASLRRQKAVVTLYGRD